MGAKENKVERYLHTEVTKRGGTTRKWVAPGVAGVPDRVVIVFGVVLFVEVKTIDGKLSAVQKREHERLAAAGAMVTTVYGHEGVDKFVDFLEENFGGTADA